MLRMVAHIALVGLVIGAAQAQPSAPARPDVMPYRDAAGRIIEAALASDEAWTQLEQLCDDIGHRLSGSAALDRAIEWAASTLRRGGAENVRVDPVMVPKWVRGRESATLLTPLERELPMLGLGGSVGTPPEGVTAEVIVVGDENELNALPDERVRGRIVLFNKAMPPYSAERGTSYGPTVKYRSQGARLAAARGAVAALVRSVTARSLQSPHTGGMNYGDAKTKVPTAAITVEDAESMARMQARGIPVRVTLRMEAKDEGLVPSGNVIGELRGREAPDEVVVIGGHIDSWDVGQGAHDDGAGCVISMEAIRLLRKLDLRPRRTIRVVLWTNEENGLAGGKAYAEKYKDDLAKHVAAIESDSGAFAPRGFSVSHVDAAREKRAVQQLSEIVKLLEPLGAAKAEGGGGGADIGPLKPFGVPVMGHEVDNSIYFDYHHTHADTLDKVDRTDLNRNVAAMAIMAYVLADMPGRLGDE
ncbi:MAG: M20/M25/M40 family metallo-hydrolase [Phycisphaerae bacterium]